MSGRGTAILAPERNRVNRNVWLYGEPSVDELLRDPIARILMRHDRITEADVRAAIDPVVLRLRREAEAATRLVA